MIHTDAFVQWGRVGLMFDTISTFHKILMTITNISYTLPKKDPKNI